MNYECAICGRKLKSCISLCLHLKTHKIESKEYYDRYIKKKKEGVCRFCKNKTSFLNITKGYRITCGNFDCVYKLRCKTNLKKYGVISSSNSIEVKNKIKNTNLLRYGSTSWSCSKEGKKTLSKINSSKEVQNKSKKTCIQRYGVKYALQNESINKKARKSLENLFTVEDIERRTAKASKTYFNRTGYKNPFKNPEIKKKIKNSNIKIYGCSNPSSNIDVKNKREATYFNKTGYKNPSSNPEVKEIKKKTTFCNYGVENPSQSKIIHAKQFSHKRKDNHGYLSNSEYKFSKKLKDTFYFKSEYYIKGKNFSHHFDFAIFKHGKLDVLVEIDGEYFHGLLSDCDGKQCSTSTINKDHLRFSLVPKGVKFLAIDSKKIKEGFKELRRIYQLTYKEWIKDMIKNIPKSIPYYSFSKERMRKDYEHLCKYDYHKNANLGISTIKNFHKSLFNSIDWSKRSSLIKEHRVYYSPVSSHNPLDGLVPVGNICEIRRILCDKIKKYSTVFNPKHNSSVMLAVCSLGKSYLGMCNNKKYLEESKSIIVTHGLNAHIKTKINNEYDCLVSFVKNKKEIELIKKKFICKRYIFLTNKIHVDKEK